MTSVIFVDDPVMDFQMVAVVEASSPTDSEFLPRMQRLSKLLSKPQLFLNLLRSGGVCLG